MCLKYWRSTFLGWGCSGKWSLTEELRYLKLSFCFCFFFSFYKTVGTNAGMMFHKVTFVITHCKCYSPSTKHSIKLKSSEKYQAPLQQLYLSEYLGFFGVHTGLLCPDTSLTRSLLLWAASSRGHKTSLPCGAHPRFPKGSFISYLTKLGDGFLHWQLS